MKIIILRHANPGKDGISAVGKLEVEDLAIKLTSVVGSGKAATIWSSTAPRAEDTAKLLALKLSVDDVVYKPELWSDKDHQHNIDWLRGEVARFEGGILILITHLEYTVEFPQALGFEESSIPSYAEGFMIEGCTCTRVTWKP